MLQLEDSWIYQAGARKGEAKGKLEAQAQAVLQVLAARGIAVSEGVRDQILACTDRERLQRYLSRAAVVGSAAEILAEGANGKG